MKCLLVILFLICIALVHITNAELELELGLDNVVETENTIDDSTFKLVVKELQDLLNSGKANEAFEIIQNLDPSHRQEESVLILYGRALVQLGKVHEGQAVFENILNVNPSSMDANLLMAKLHMRQSSWDTVEKYVASILQIDSLQITASKSLTSAALGTDISDLLTSLSDTTILKYAIAYSYLSKVVLIRDKDVNKALSLMSKAVELDPLNAEIQFDLGIMLFTVGKFSDGRRAFDETTRLGPALAQTASIANVYIQYGQFEWAIEALEQVYS